MPADRDPRAIPTGDPLRRTAWWSTLLSAAGLALGVLIGSLLAGPAGAWGALLGVGLPTVFFGLTLALALLTKRTTGGALGALILGSWLVKLIALVVVLAILQPLTFYHRPVFAGALLGWTAVMLGLEVRVIKRTRQFYVEPRSDGR